MDLIKEFQFQPIWDSSIAWIQQADPNQLYSSIILLGILLLFVAYPRRRHRKGPGKMTDQRVFEVLFSDAITSAIEEMVHKGRMTEKQARKMYLKCYHKLHLPDLKPNSLIPQKLHKYKAAILKAAIKLRTNGGPTHVKPLPIPEPSNVVLIKKPTVVRRKRTAA
jgi:hypothetical protein